jgi:hypothetical protein
LKVLLAAVVLLAVAGGAWFVAQQRHSVAPAVPTPAPTDAPAPTAPPEPTPTTAPEPTVAVKEVPTSALVTFKSNIYSELSINGKRQSANLPRATTVSLKPGRYVAVFDAPGFMKIPREFEISPTDPKPVTVSAEFPGRGSVTFTVVPAGAEIRLDGVLIGASTGAPMKKTLRAGPHEISVSLAGHRTYTRTIDVAEDDSFAIPRIELKRE